MKTIEALTSAIEVLEAKLREHEKAGARYKQMINELCLDAGQEPRYPDAGTETHDSIGSIRSDRFHGVALATGVREYLQLRRNANFGPAAVNEIFAALKQGGYVFETRDEENAKRGLRQSLTKNSPLFYRLPNGEYGLRAWYPNIKEAKEPKVKKRYARRTKERARPATHQQPTAKRSAGQEEASVVKAGGIVDDVVAVLKASGAPMKTDQIVRALEARGRKTSALPLSGQLSRFAKQEGSLLRKVAKNIFGLAESTKRGTAGDEREVATN